MWGSILLGSKAPSIEIEVREHHKVGNNAFSLGGKEHSTILVRHASDFVHTSDHVVCLEGRLSNEEALRRSLDLSSDACGAQLVLASYLKWGADCVQRFRGGISFLVVDKKGGHVRAFRDQLGLVPLYYAIADGVFYFSDLLHHFLHTPDFQKIDWSYIQIHLSYRYPHTLDKTPLHDVKRLPPSHHLHLGDGASCTVTGYRTFAPDDLRHLRSYQEVVEVFREKLETAVYDQVKPEQKFACHMSGGLDSTGITAISQSLCKAHGKEVVNYICGLSEPQRENPYHIQDEKGTVDRILANSQIKPPIWTDYQTPITLSSIADHSLTPRFWGANVYLEKTFRSMKDQGMNMLLSGFGGDQCITHNEVPAYLISALTRGKLRHLWSDGLMVDWRQTARMTLPHTPIIGKLVTWLKPHLKTALPTNTPRNKQLIKDQKRIQVPFHLPDHLNEHIISALTSPSISYRLEYEREYAISQGMEIRYPYLDLDMINFFLGVPAKFKRYKGHGREIYREAIKKWIPNGGDVFQRKSKAPTIPSLGFLYHEALDKGTLDYQVLQTQIPSRLWEMIDLPSIPKDWQSENDQHQFRMHFKLAELSAFINRVEGKG